MGTHIRLPYIPPAPHQHSSQFYDLIEIFRIGGYAPHTNYLFLGARPANRRAARVLNKDGLSR